MLSPRAIPEDSGLRTGISDLIVWLATSLPELGLDRWTRWLIREKSVWGLQYWM